MRAAAALLEELRAVDESTTIEAKAASKIDRSVLETICSFSNEPGLGGGYLLLGVAQTSQLGLYVRGYEVIGGKTPEQLQSDLASQCAAAFNQAVRPQMVAEEVDGKAVIVAFVPELPSAEKPLYLKSLGLPRGAFRRVGPTDQEGTEDDLVSLYNGRQGESLDSAIVRDASLGDLDSDALRIYRELRREAHPEAEELTWPDEDLLRALGAAKLDGAILRPTIAGILLFGSSMALRRCFPMMRVDYIRVPGRRWVEDPEHRFDTVEIRAPLIVAIRRAIAAIRDDLPASFRLPEGEIVRSDDTVLPIRVLREAIVNAVMHRSYRIHGPVQILRYSNRVEIRNPGHSLKAEEKLGEPGSENRNPLIAAVLHEVHLAETKGSGIRVMRELMLSNDLLPPTFESSRRPDQFVATLLFHHFLGESDLRWLRALTVEKLSDEEARALVFVREVGAIDNAAYREINGVDTLQSSLHLRRLRDLDILEMKGSGSRTYYVPGPAFVDQGSGADLTQSAADLTQSPPDLTQLAADLTQSLPPELRERLAGLGKRPREGVVRALILELCALAPWSASELAQLLGNRDSKNLVTLHLRPMKEAGELVYLHPEMPNHPQQKWVVAKKDAP